MAKTHDGLVQRELHFAIVDEVDSILIDEARTPLIISGPGEKSDDMYKGRRFCSSSARKGSKRDGYQERQRGRA